MPHVPPDRLTPREEQILELVARGMTNAGIARELDISFTSAKWHVSQILSRLDLDTRQEAADFWRAENGHEPRLHRFRFWVFLGLRVGVGLQAVVLVGFAAAVAIQLVRGGGPAMTQANVVPVVSATEGVATANADWRTAYAAAVAEVNESVLEAATCLQDSGVPALVVEGEGLRPSRLGFAASIGLPDPAHRDCFAEYTSGPAAKFRLLRPDPSVSELEAHYEAIEECMQTPASRDDFSERGGGFSGMFATYRNAPTPPVGMFGTLETYQSCADQIEAENGLLAPPLPAWSKP